MPDFIFMDDNAPAHRGRISCWRLGYLKWSGLHFLNPIENLCYELSRRVEGRDPAPQNLNDLLRAALQEEWNAIPQQTMSRL